MSSGQPDDPCPGCGTGPSSEEQRAAERAADAAAAQTPLPEVTFSTFVMSLASSALVHLGEVPEPESGRTMTNLPVAKHTIDILAMLEEKTRGNLDTEESKLLKDMLFELRMHYVRKSA